MANSGQPTISLGATGDAVKRLQRALRRTPNEGLKVDGVFNATLETAVKQFQQGAGLTADGVVGPLTWAALPDGGPMPTLRSGIDRGGRDEPAEFADEWRAGPVDHDAAGS